MTEQSLFLAALDIDDPAACAAFLDEHCAGNLDLRRRVEELLAAHDRSGEFLDRPAVEQLNAPADAVTRTIATGGRIGPDDSTHSSPSPAPPAGNDLPFLGPSTRTDALGRLAHYEVLEVLGRGGFGIVLRAFDERLHRVVAIKVLDPRLASSGAARARFIREARAGAAVRDEHVVNIHAVADDADPVPYLVMEYVGGQTLQQKLDRVGPLRIPEVLRIGSQIARGLAAAHASGLIHRDVKPSNILLENGVERVKLTDFGLARAADDASITQSGLVAGTPMYMAPEQARGETIDPQADLFSLGSVLYAMCTGHPPFRASSTLAVLKRVCEDEPRPIREVNPDVPDWLAAVITRLHAKRPTDRPASAREVANLLSQYLNEWQVRGQVTAAAPWPPAPPMPPTPNSPPTPPRRRSRWVSRLGLVAALAALVIGGVAWSSPRLRAQIDGLLGYGTVVVYIDHPGVTVTPLQEPDQMVSGLGYHPVRLRAGQYEFEAVTSAGDRSKLLTVEVRRGMYEPLGIRSSELTVRPTTAEVFPDPGNLAPYISQMGQTLRFRVVGSLAGTVWGTDTYTADSYLAAAAVHAGFLKPGEQGVLTVKVLPPLAQYTGSTRHGVTSSPYATFPASYRIEAVTDRTDRPELTPAAPVAPVPSQVIVGVPPEYVQQAGKTFVIECVGRAATVWGTEEYTADSDVAAAAVHAGLLRVGQPGRVRITILEGKPSYTGSTRNGILSHSYGPYPSSFRVEAAMPPG